MESARRAGYSTNIDNELRRSSKMKTAILKNMEALFVAALVLAGMANYAAAKIPAAMGHKAAVATVDSTMHTVSVSAKRLTAEEKAAA
jgi:hypothetical protein